MSRILGGHPQAQNGPVLNLIFSSLACLLSIELAIAQPPGPPAATIRAAGSGSPQIFLRDGQKVPTRYSGQSLPAHSWQPLSLASADFDEDGMPDLAAVSADMHLHVGDISAPALPGRLETGPGDFEGHLVFKNSAADFEATLTTDIQRGFDLIDGPVKARFSAHGEVAGKAEAAVALDLKGARMRAPAGLAWEKAAGVAA